VGEEKIKSIGVQNIPKLSAFAARAIAAENRFVPHLELLAIRRADHSINRIAHANVIGGFQQRDSLERERPFGSRYRLSRLSRFRRATFNGMQPQWAFDLARCDDEDVWFFVTSGTDLLSFTNPLTVFAMMTNCYIGFHCIKFNRKYVVGSRS
jgi:hypothetical protein